MQRVESASVSVGGVTTGEIGRGLLVFVGVAAGDSTAAADQMVDKILRLRIFEDENGKMNRSLLDCGHGLLIVSQFTLLADLSKGRRPSFERAAPIDEARNLYNYFVEVARSSGLFVATGVFQAQMEVRLHNSGPVTIVHDVCIDK